MPVNNTLASPRVLRKRSFLGKHGRIVTLKGMYRSVRGVDASSAEVGSACVRASVRVCTCACVRVCVMQINVLALIKASQDLTFVTAAHSSYSSHYRKKYPRLQ